MLLSRFFDCGMLENKGICNYNKRILSRFFCIRTSDNTELCEGGCYG